MGKNPAFQFYPGDWTRDLDDQDLEIEGAWIRICCRLWWTGGTATKSLDEWARILRRTQKKTMKIFQNLIEKDIASGTLLDNQSITITSRRIKRDIEISKIRQEVGKLGGNPKLKKTQNALLNQSDNQNPTPSSSTSKNNIYIESFNEFYRAYPRHIGKAAAQKAWLKLKPDIDLHMTILKAIEAQKATIWNGKETQFIPHPATWLNGKRWEDEVATVKATGFMEGWNGH